MSKLDIPPGDVLYRIDRSRASLGELWRDSNSPLVLIAFLTKLLRARLPGSTNDPNVESLHPFQVNAADLPEDIAARFSPKILEFQAFGFDTRRPIAHVLFDLLHDSRTYMLAAARSDGLAVARVFLRLEGPRMPPKAYFHCEILSELRNGRFIWSTGARATLNTPKMVSLCRLPSATPSALWAIHAHELEQFRNHPGIVPAAETGAVIELLDRHHALIRDHHLARGLFTPMTDADRRGKAAITLSYETARADGFAYPEVVAEMERLQTPRGGRGGGIMVLAASAVLFIAADLLDANASNFADRIWELTALLLPIVFLHELGHYIAMRALGYRNVRMFFIPFVGAAVVGWGFGTPGWKKAVVALMGPLPGIFLGGILGMAGLLTHHELLLDVAMMSFLINGLNLLPILPLDGGRVVQALIPPRHYLLDVALRFLAAAAFITFSLIWRDYAIIWLGVFLLIGIPISVKVGRVAAEIQRNGFVPPENPDSIIPAAVAETIIARLVPKNSRPRKCSNKTTALKALLAYDGLCSRAPSWAASLGFGALHAGALAFAAIFAIAVIFPNGVSFSSFMPQQKHEPALSISPAEISLASGPMLTGASITGQDHPITVVAYFLKPAQAVDNFNALSASVDAGQQLVRFGQKLLVSLPKSDNAARRRWIDLLEPRAVRLTVDNSDITNIWIQLSCTAPDDMTAMRLSNEICVYLAEPAEFYLLPPWSPDVKVSSTQWKRLESARLIYDRLEKIDAGSQDSPRIKTLEDQVTVAIRHGDLADLSRVNRQLAATRDEIRTKKILAIKAAHEPDDDPVVIDAYLQLPPRHAAEEQNATSNPAYDILPAYQIIAQRMGQIAMNGKTPVPSAARYCANNGWATNVGRQITLRFTFTDLADGAPAMVRWLAAQGCKEIKYEFDGDQRQ